MKLQVVRKSKDPIALRISIGGSQSNAYIVYRGDLVAIKMLLTQVTELFAKLEEANEPMESPDEGKKYA